MHPLALALGWQKGPSKMAAIANDLFADCKNYQRVTFMICGSILIFSTWCIFWRLFLFKSPRLLVFTACITRFPNTCCFFVQPQMMARNRVTFTPARGQTTSATTIPAFGSTPSQGPLMRRPPFVMPTRATWQLSVTFTMALLARCFCMFTT